MKAQATALYPFVPSRAPISSTALAFFAELGFETLWSHDGLAGLRYRRGVSFCRPSRCRTGRRTRC